MTTKGVAIFWFRRDLRLEDNIGLAEALASGCPVVPLFIFDTDILERLEDNEDARVQFLHNRITELDRRLREFGSSLVVKHGRPRDVWKGLLKEHKINSVYYNHDYEPAALARDESVDKILRSAGVKIHSYKDQVIFEKSEILKDSGGSYTVFTPYSKKWKALFQPKMAESRVNDSKAFAKMKASPIPDLREIGFRPSLIEYPEPVADRKLLAQYGELRNTPGVRGTSRLGVHLRFGTISVRELVTAARATSEVWLNELIWREFFMQILFHYPHVVDGPFRPEYAGIEWRHDEDQFRAWCEGQTGYPLVDAGMRELNKTGFMHNRVRMVAGSFLTKHLLIDWRWGEAYFARKLLDFDLAANNGNWQWVAGTGCDAAPYFRIFNPETQMKTFDAKLEYVRRWVPEFGTSEYPDPLVDHVYARERALSTYKAGLAKSPKI